ncbi:MAG: polysaccharide deacetylase family protein [Desulfitobacteriaceae bacterium]|nr:polysaccharide deacetylase family protein [Desulfitobacteriaceae bacterium]MDI6877988.1 polysaccharide deacetylase family protein [Desulfitobacteriaceae bacterium]MDI6914159.1 polysaccharide deacetylase family protein [Desulfitobacteriaceae bacterium]
MKRITLLSFMLSILIVATGCGSQAGENASSAQATMAKPTPAADAPASVSVGPSSATSNSTTPLQQARVPAQDISALPVLYYHSVKVEQGNELCMPPNQLREQMNYLKEHGYQTISPAQMASFLKGEGILPEHPVLITFDDGYANNYTDAYPILKEFGFTATVFMISGALDSSGFLSTRQIQELSTNGWTIGGHTKNHEHLPQLDAAHQAQEMKDSKAVLEQKLGRPVSVFAYPYGEYNAQVKKAVQDDGYALAFTTERGWAKQGADPLLLHRVYLYANMGLQEFQRRIENPNY